MKHPFTKEQTRIIEAETETLVVRAFAGTGKTSTLIGFADARPNRKMLYVAYNRSIRDEASRKFPRNVHCVTSHQLAFKSIGHRYADKLENPLTMVTVKKSLNIQNWVVARGALHGVRRFMSTPDDSINESHLSHLHLDRFAFPKAVDAARELWNRMSDPQDPLPTDHDMYLKLYQLSGVDISWKYDYILFDEAQDANPVTTDIVTRQDCKIVLVGDTHQQIYRFRGAEDALSSPMLGQPTSHSLTHSFRFGPHLAFIANKILAHKGEPQELVGRSKNHGLAEPNLSLKGPLAKVCRTSAGVIEQALIAAKDNRTIYWVGGMKGYDIGALCDLYRFRYGNYEKMYNTTLIDNFGDFDGFEAAAEESEDPGMKRSINLLNQLGNIPKLAYTCKQNTVRKMSDADVVVTTAHRSKGLEFDNVVLSSDFPTLERFVGMEAKPRCDELNLLYVAATRAERNLTFNDSLAAVINAKPGELDPA